MTEEKRTRQPLTTEGLSTSLCFGREIRGLMSKFSLRMCTVWGFAGVGFVFVLAGDALLIFSALLGP